MPNMTLRSSQQLADFLLGCGILSTGGGGEPARGLEMVESFVLAGGQVSWVDVSEIPDDAWTISAWGMGSIAPEDAQQQIQRNALGLTQKTHRYNIDQAIRELEQYAGVKAEYLVPVELGGVNTVGPMIAALQLGIPIVDGDYSGRAAPELSQTSPLILGLPSLPMSSVDGWGNTCILKKAINLAVSERIGKFLSLASLSSVFMAGFLLQGRDVKRCLVPATLTTSFELGRAVREARESGDDPLQAALHAGEGFLLFHGRVSRKDWEDRDGYLYATIYIKGSGNYAGQDARIWLKNENHVFWVNDEPRVTAPDLICVLDASTSEPITNTYLAEGMDVAVLGFRGAEIWRSPEGLELNGPRYFGFDISYVPIEERFA